MHLLESTSIKSFAKLYSSVLEKNVGYYPKHCMKTQSSPQRADSILTLGVGAVIDGLWVRSFFWIKNAIYHLHLEFAAFLKSGLMCLNLWM